MTSPEQKPSRPAAAFDTSPLIFLDLLGYAGAVAGRYRALAPPAVAAELSIKPDQPGGRVVSGGLVEVIAPAPERVRGVRRDLNAGAGEVEAIALALELEVPVVLDDAVPCRYAREKGLEVWGTLLVLLRLHRAGAGLRSAEADVKLLVRGGMWLGRRVIAEFLAGAARRE